MIRRALRPVVLIRARVANYLSRPTIILRAPGSVRAEADPATKSCESLAASYEID